MIDRKQKTLFSATLATVLAIGIIGLVSVQAEQSSDSSSPTEDQIKEIASYEFSDEQKREFKTIAKDHPEVAPLLENREIKSEGIGIAGNLKYPEKRSAVVYYITEDNSISVAINEQTKEVEDIAVHDPIKMVPDNAFAVSKYTDTEAIEGIQMHLDMPTYNHQTGADDTMIVLNAAKLGSDTSNLCDWQNAPDDYWMQSGVVFDADDTFVAFTDTVSNCVIVDVTEVSWSTGDTLRFRNYVVDNSGTSNDKVLTFIYNKENSDYFTYDRVVEDTEQLMIKDPHTSVFFENTHDDDSISWEDGFSNEELTVSSAEIKTLSGSSYVTWGNSSNVALDCGGNTDGNSLMDGKFENSPNSVTWDLLKMRQECYRQ